MVRLTLVMCFVSVGWAMRAGRHETHEECADSNPDSLQEQFALNLQRSRELRGIVEPAALLSMTRRHNRDRKERQRKRREANPRECDRHHVLPDLAEL